MRSHIISLFFVISLIFLMPLSVYAEKQSDSLRFLGEFDDWSLYTEFEEGQKVCFIVSSPIYNAGTYKNRKEQFLWIRHIDNDMDEVSLTPGYHFKPGVSPEIAFYQQSIKNYKSSIDVNTKLGKCDFKNKVKSYTLDIISKDQAWARHIQTDKSIVKDLISSSYAIVSAHSVKDTCSLDVYSSIGFTKAYKKMKDECRKSDHSKH